MHLCNSKPRVYPYFRAKFTFKSEDKVKSKEISKEKRAQIQILHETSKSQREIARIVGVSKKGVQTILGRYTKTTVDAPEDQKKYLYSLTETFW